MDKLARCEGREPNHVYYKECTTCLRKLLEPDDDSVYIYPWVDRHGPCPDRREQQKHQG